MTEQIEFWLNCDLHAKVVNTHTKLWEESVYWIRTTGNDRSLIFREKSKWCKLDANNAEIDHGIDPPLRWPRHPTYNTQSGYVWVIYTIYIIIKAHTQLTIISTHTLQCRWIPLWSVCLHVQQNTQFSIVYYVSNWHIFTLLITASLTFTLII